MELFTINAGFFKLDGGAMFGVVPKTIWQKTNPADENNLCPLAMRCLLVVDGKRAMLIDNGCGDKQSEKFFSYYYLHGDDSLVKSLAKMGMSPDDVTDNLLSHLHFDHCGGGVIREGEKVKTLFSNATYWSNTHHWKWATEPNLREKPSFLPENILPMKETGQLKFVEDDFKFSGVEILYASGHTDKMMLPKIQYKGRTIVFVADLLPTVGHIPLSYVMGYDTRPLISLQEKENFLKEAVANHYVLFLGHDPVNECCTVKLTDKGIRLDETFRLHEI